MRKHVWAIAYGPVSYTHLPILKRAGKLAGHDGNTFLRSKEIAESQMNKFYVVLLREL